MPPAKGRAWNEVLDNLGENLIRLGTSLSVLAEAPAASTDDSAFATSMEHIATGFRLAFRQARPALVAGETDYVQLARASVEELAATHAITASELVGTAHTLVHEGVLVCQEMVNLLNQIEEGSRADPERTRQTFAPSLRHLSETTASAGWDLRTICHEYDAEVRRAQLGGAPPRDLVPASVGLLRDMSAAAQSLRLARREWFRAGQRLASATVPPASGTTPPA